MTDRDLALRLVETICDGLGLGPVSTATATSFVRSIPDKRIADLLGRVRGLLA